MKSKAEMTKMEKVILYAEYERMLAIAKERNCFSQEFRLETMMEELRKLMEEEDK